MGSHGLVVFFLIKLLNCFQIPGHLPPNQPTPAMSTGFNHGLVGVSAADLVVGSIYGCNIEFPAAINEPSPVTEIPPEIEEFASPTPSPPSPRTEDAQVGTLRRRYHAAYLFYLDPITRLATVFLGSSQPRLPHRFVPWLHTIPMAGQPTAPLIPDPPDAFAAPEDAGFLNFSHPVRLRVVDDPANVARANSVGPPSPGAFRNDYFTPRLDSVAEEYLLRLHHQWLRRWRRKVQAAASAGGTSGHRDGMTGHVATQQGRRPPHRQRAQSSYTGPRTERMRKVAAHRMIITRYDDPESDSESDGENVSSAGEDEDWEESMYRRTAEGGVHRVGCAPLGAVLMKKPNDVEPPGLCCVIHRLRRASFGTMLVQEAHDREGGARGLVHGICREGGRGSECVEGSDRDEVIISGESLSRAASIAVSSAATHEREIVSFRGAPNGVGGRDAVEAERERELKIVEGGAAGAGKIYHAGGREPGGREELDRVLTFACDRCEARRQPPQIFSRSLSLLCKMLVGGLLLLHGVDVGKLRSGLLHGPPISTPARRRPKQLQVLPHLAPKPMIILIPDAIPSRIGRFPLWVDAREERDGVEVEDVEGAPEGASQPAGHDVLSEQRDPPQRDGDARGEQLDDEIDDVDHEAGEG
ncbi:hypothetical protein BDK51DRAFT_46736 [Blyttiomyces helicus]|uniref:Uncharacterized protein n=1 Tax=Blyttiomyces helicus TaxID=388810 RepID=A0A4P9WDC1_9FUNG|nr:hypothetical protein BDK51DRAFT_46736 [Blyttiomyces helicus]|eukprot:RKO89218.1 hypothetical protein BDK51DRAFT_46736 [Blyttiomyces helicus]